MSVFILELDSPTFVTGLYVWLCKGCERARVKAGWTVKARKAPPHALTCQDCGKGAS
jgi:hypothetical protein